MLLQVQNLEKTYQTGKKVLDGLDFEMCEKEFVGILGLSGCGKTTLLKLISGLDRADGGKITYKGNEMESLSKQQRTFLRKMDMGMIFQDFQLVECLTVGENIALPLEMSGMLKEEAQEEVQKILKEFGIQSLAERFPKEISGGEKQRTAIARALIKKPSLIFADEPTGNLDRHYAGIVLKTFENISREYSVLMVTHDLYAASFCNRIMVLNGGKIKEQMIRCGSRRTFFQELLDSFEEEEGF